jgi:hypothetical protein
MRFPQKGDVLWVTLYNGLTLKVEVDVNVQGYLFGRTLPTLENPWANPVCHFGYSGVTGVASFTFDGV